MKHAYLIMAHNQLDLLNKLLLCLDHRDNDIIIHIDKKSDIKEQEIGIGIEQSRLYFTERTNITWGGYCQINADLLMLKKAFDAGHHDYYHLLSGVDLPIKSMDYINTFFEKNNYNFIHFSAKDFSEKRYSRVRYKHLFLEKCGRTKNTWSYLHKYCVLLQGKLGVKNKYIDISEFYIGSAFWSIKEDYAKYIISKEKEISKMFRYSLCGDESWMQVMIKKSPYKDSLYVKTCQDDCHGNMRYIDFYTSHGSSPETITENNIYDVLKSDYLFARKFDNLVSPKAVDIVINYISRPSMKSKEDGE